MLGGWGAKKLKAQSSRLKGQRQKHKAESSKLKAEGSKLKVKSISLASRYRTTVFLNRSFCIKVFI